MEIEIRLPGPDDPFGPRRARPEDLGPDDLGNSGVLRATLEDEAKQVTADFAELENARRKAEEEIGLERAGVEMNLERARLAALPEEDSGDGEGRTEDPVKAFTAFARERINALPVGTREDAALHAGRERLRLERARRGGQHNAEVARLQRGVDESLDALTAQAAREPESLVELAERGLGLLEATGAGLRFDAEQQKAIRGRFGATLATTALRAMEPKQALAALQGSGLQALVPDEDTRAALTAELTVAEASQKRALKAETGALMRLHLERLDNGEPGVPEIARDVEIDFGAEDVKAFTEQAEGARQRHLLRQQWQFAPEAEIASTVEQVEATGDPTAAQAVAEEIRAARRRDPAAAVSEQPKLQALQAAAEEDPAQRGLAAGVSLELQTELGIPEAERRVLTRQGLSDLMGQIEAAPPVQRAPLLRDIKESYGAHFEQVLGELETARLDPTTLALARRLDDPLAVLRIGALQGKTRAALSEGLDLAEVTAVSAAARAAVPGPLALAAERVALARYRQSGDQDDAVAVARETLGVGGEDTLAGGAGDDDGKGDETSFQDRGRDLRDAFIATVTPEPLDRAVEDIESAQARAQQGEAVFTDASGGDVRIGDSVLDAKTAGLLNEALSVQQNQLDAFRRRLGQLRVSGELTSQQTMALRRAAKHSAGSGLLDPAMSRRQKRSRTGDLLRALDRRMVVRQRLSESMQQIVEGSVIGKTRVRAPGVTTNAKGAGGPPGREKKQRKPTPTAEDVAALPGGPGWTPDRQFISGEAFAKLPPKGRIDPQTVRTSQHGFSKDFKPEKPFGRRSIDDMVAEIQADPSKADKIKPVRLVESGGHVYTVDHRRLIAFRRLGIEIPYVRVPRGSLNKKERGRIDSAPLFNDNGAFILNRHANTKE